MNSRARSSVRRAERGTILIVAMLICSIIAISISSYIALSTNSLKFANRSYYNTAAINLAETGVEEALWSFNQVTGGAALSTAWDGWDTSDGTTAKRTFTDFTLSANASVEVKVYVDHFNPPDGSTPKVVAEATVTIANESRTVAKWVELTLRRRSKFAMGLVAKNQITFNGNNASVDSWNSDPDNNPATAAIAYSAAVKNDHGSVGSTSVAVGSVAVNNADIWGFASVGGNTTADLSVGNQGTVAAFGNPQGTVDTTRVATDFTANFDATSNPTSGTVLASVGSSIGTDGATNVYRYSGTISSDLTIHGNVTLVLTTGAGTSAISQTGHDGITLASGATLIIYTAGDVKIAGNGVLNNNDSPATFQLWGTSTSASPQSIQIAGNGALKGIVYAPNGSVKINGNGDVLGSVVANDITVVGNAAFHYDESLANLGGNNPWGVVKWRELKSDTDRSAYTTPMSGW